MPTNQTPTQATPAPPKSTSQYYTSTGFVPVHKFKEYKCPQVIYTDDKYSSQAHVLVRLTQEPDLEPSLSIIA